MQYLLTYAGVPFVCDEGFLFRPAEVNPDPELAALMPENRPTSSLMEEVNRIIPLYYLQDFVPPASFPGKNVDALALKDRSESQPSAGVRVGDWYYPSGCVRWSVFRGLATSSQAAAMLQRVSDGGFAPQAFVMRASPDEPDTVNTPTSSYTVSTPMYMLPPRPLAEHDGGFDGLFLITLVDERYYWQYSSVSLQVYEGTTWEDLIENLSSVLGVAINYSEIEPGYTAPEPDSQLWVNLENSAQLLEAVAHNLGREAIRSLDGSYNLLTPEESGDLVRANRGDPQIVVRSAGGDLFGEDVGLKSGDLRGSRNLVVPESVVVSFPKYVYGNDPVPHFLNPRYSEPRSSTWYEDSYGAVYSVTVPVAEGGPSVEGLTGVPGVSHSIEDTAKAMLSAEASEFPDNLDGLTELATLIAQAYYAGQAEEALDECYAGTYAWTPEGIHDLVWTYSERHQQARLRVMRTEWNAVVLEMQHATPGVDGLPTPVAGVGGKSVALTVRDSQTVAPTTFLTSDLGILDLTAELETADNLPTDHRWKGRVENEVILFGPTEGTTTAPVVSRGLDGTKPDLHPAGSPVTQVVPSVNYGTNLITHGPGVFTYPDDGTPNGVSGVTVVAQTQSVYVTSDEPTILGEVPYYPGVVVSYDTVTGEYVGQEEVWVFERNGEDLDTAAYDGQFFGYTPDPVRPVYAVNVGSGGGGSWTFVEVQDEFIQLTPDDAFTVFNYTSTQEENQVILPPVRDPITGESLLENGFQVGFRCDGDSAFPFNVLPYPDANPDLIDGQEELAVMPGTHLTVLAWTGLTWTAFWQNNPGFEFAQIPDGFHHGSSVEAANIINYTPDGIASVPALVVNRSPSAGYDPKEPIVPVRYVGVNPEGTPIYLFSDRMPCFDQGDMIGFDGDNYGVVPLGTDGQILMVTGGEFGYEWVDVKFETLVDGTTSIVNNWNVTFDLSVFVFNDTDVTFNTVNMVFNTSVLVYNNTQITYDTCIFVYQFCTVNYTTVAFVFVSCTFNYSFCVFVYLSCTYEYNLCVFVYNETTINYNTCILVYIDTTITYNNTNITLTVCEVTYVEVSISLTSVTEVYNTSVITYNDTTINYNNTFITLTLTTFTFVNSVVVFDVNTVISLYGGIYLYGCPLYWSLCWYFGLNRPGIVPSPGIPTGKRPVFDDSTWKDITLDPPSDLLKFVVPVPTPTQLPLKLNKVPVGPSEFYVGPTTGPVADPTFRPIEPELDIPGFGKVKVTSTDTPGYLQDKLTVPTNDIAYTPAGGSSLTLQNSISKLQGKDVDAASPHPMNALVWYPPENAWIPRGGWSNSWDYVKSISCVDGDLVVQMGTVTMEGGRILTVG